MINSDEIIFLLGAGASTKAGVRTSKEMIGELEELLEIDEDWKVFRNIYYLIKSSVIYSAGVKGNSNPGNFNIETLVNTIDELLKSDEHPLYPFVGSWIPKLELLSENKIKELKLFREKIVDELKNKWIRFTTRNAKYYKGLQTFKQSFNFPLRIFSLNYDLCIEKTCKDMNIEQGFNSTDDKWSWQNFEDNNPNDIDIFLYKLHGSIDWKRVEGVVTRSEDPIDSDELEIIFATAYKLQYLDPFLFFAYEFRKFTLFDDLKLIVSIGYSFNDEHVNGILRQSLNSNHERKLLSIAPYDSEANGINEIQTKLELAPGHQIEVLVGEQGKAEHFFSEGLEVSTLERYIPREPNPFE